VSEAAEKLRDAVASWKETRSELARLSTQQLDDWRLKTVRLRRALQEQIGLIGAAMNELDTATQAFDEFVTLRRALSTVRSQLAMHQAQWPAVAIQPEDRQYKASAASLRQANDVFAEAAERLMRRLVIKPQPRQSKEPT
jgi:hypothetical protein